MAGESPHLEKGGATLDGREGLPGSWPAWTPLGDPPERLGKTVPDAIKNQPWNIKPMPSAEAHGRISGSYKGKPRFNAVERHLQGTPTWSKVATGAAVGHPIAAAKARREDK
jgi:hypothetical protein